MPDTALNLVLSPRIISRHDVTTWSQVDPTGPPRGKLEIAAMIPRAHSGVKELPNRLVGRVCFEGLMLLCTGGYWSK